MSTKSLFRRWVERLPSTTINVNGKPYLTRYYVFLKDRKWGNIYIHHFRSSDQGLELHNHPWLFALSILLRSGYLEEYRIADGRVLQRSKVAVSIDGLLARGLLKTLKLGTNVITRKDFHRVDLLDEANGTWSIFFAGPRTDEWGFWNRETNKFTHFSENPEAIP